MWTGFSRSAADWKCLGLPARDLKAKGSRFNSGPLHYRGRETMSTKWYAKLSRVGACEEAREWARTQPDAETAWNNCERGDWMLWIIGRTAAGKPWSEERKPLVLAACKCARLALKYVPKGEKRPRKAIETAEAWVRGETTGDEVRASAYAAYASTSASSANEVADAAAASASATYAAYAASSAAYVAAYAAYAARKTTLRECADIVRGYYSINNGKVCPK
jgi:hypothetical protein